LGSNLGAWQPIAAILGTVMSRGLLIVAILALCAGFLRAEFKSRVLRVLMLVLLAAALVGSWGGPSDFVKQFLAQLILVGFVVFGIARIARFNILGWFLVVAIIGLAGGAAELLSQPNSFYRTQGYGVVLLLVVLLAWPLILWRRSKIAATP
jgi:hypothetical protein